ncbi:MFS transporter [Stenomitos frigidus]|uniref:MFS transporter n=1 Tax=Stenomitos frigidus ULC18 TaxID=2107698 RepID=A0A2T1DTZ4_9CYAN|nr:MFS transporter [Stenomitos frigidus]PSB23942.1 MFS transporter [Stenomitos frigidus ULC18]
MHNHASSESPTLDKLSLSTKLAYGAGDLGTAITANILAVFLLIFFTDVAGLGAGLAGSILLIGKVWDAINDPIVGILSDRSHSRWGRRLPWLIVGSVPFGIFFFLQWLVPHFSDNPSTNQWGLFWYYVVIAIIFNSFYTIVNLPYTALTPELTQDYDERTSLNSYRFAFSISGSILSLLLALGIFSAFKGDPTKQYLVLGAVCGVISILPLYWCVWGTRKRVMVTERLRQETSSGESLPYLEQLKIAFTNRPFLYVIGIYLCSWLAVQNTVAIIPYFVKNWMGLTDADFTKVVIAVQVTGLVMLFVWSEVSKRVGKKVVYFMGMSLWIIAEIGLFFLQPGQNGLMYLLAVMAGFGVSTAYLIPWSMIPDVIELDELNTGQRREGIFYGFMVLLQKVGLAIGLFLVGQVLEYSGFVATAAGQAAPMQPPAALWAIRLLIGPVPTVILLVGLLLTYFYPITREVHAEILLKLQERKRNQAQDKV